MIYIGVDATGRVMAEFQGDVMPTGPYTYYEVSSSVGLTKPANASFNLMWVAGSTAWVDLRTLIKTITFAVSEVDTLGDEARTAVVGDPVRVVEYKRAEEAARAFKASSYSGTAPSSVSSWAAAKGWTTQQSADDIIAAADRWYGALDYIRSIRLKAKEDIKKVTTNAQADTILATFKATLTTAMQGIQ